MKASSDNNDFRARGWGWLGSLETGLPFSITDNLMLEPQLQYTWQGLSLDDGQDNAGYVKFGHGSAHMCVPVSSGQPQRYDLWRRHLIP